MPVLNLLIKKAGLLKCFDYSSTLPQYFNPFCSIVILCKKRAIMSKGALNEPIGQHFFEVYTALSHIHVACYTSCALPYLHIKKTAVKVISKDK